MIRARADAAWGDELHRRFRRCEGSEFIASGFALGAIRTQVRKRRPRSVLEVGAGIGAITSALAEVLAELPEASQQVAVEDVPFCLDHLARNLGDSMAAVTVADQVRLVPPALGDFDLVVVDGGAVEDLLESDRQRWSPADEEAEVAAWMARLAPGALVLVENRRDRQRGFIEAQARRSGRRFVHEHDRPLDASPGVHAYWFEPSAARAVAVRGREALRAVWFPRGVRAWRRLQVRLGRPPRARAAVSPGGGAQDR